MKYVAVGQEKGNPPKSIEVFTSVAAAAECCAEFVAARRDKKHPIDSTHAWAWTAEFKSTEFPCAWVECINVVKGKK